MLCGGALPEQDRKGVNRLFLEMKGISFKYSNTETDIVKNFGLTAERGEIIAVVGLSGSGKSTVLRLIAGLELPWRGCIRINGRTMVDNSVFVPPEKRNVGMVFQDYALFPHLTVYANIGFGITGLAEQARSARIFELLRLINMTEFSKRYPHQLSGGQQQRVAVARALAPRPHLLLLDEPFSNIDAGLRQKMRQEIRGILKAENATCIFVTHDQADVADMADRTIQM